ncbi:MAG TPA: tetratricopeptide repeat protein, partial [Blastocatellia bacterium]|nr:tetratricopeptide repeat protein [Blastocatellia bacterium]
MFRPPTPGFWSAELPVPGRRSIPLLAIPVLLTLGSLALRTEAYNACPGPGQDKTQGVGTSTKIELVNLEVSRAVDGRLSSGEKSTYQLILTSGQYASLIVEQRGIDVIIRLIGANDKPVSEVDSELGASGQERIEIVAETDGYYRLVVEAKGRQGTESGAYRVTLAELRASTEQDRSLQEARRSQQESLALRRAGKYAEALVPGQRALEILERVKGPDDADVGSALANLGEAYRLKGDYNNAEVFHLRALEVRQKALGPDHLQVSFSLNNLGLLYYDKGDLAKAEQFQKR